MDEDIFVKLVELLGIVFDESQVVFEAIGLGQNHAAFDAALEGGLLVVREIDALGFTKHGEKLVDIVGRCEAQKFIGASGNASDVGMLFDPGEFLGDGLGRENKVDGAGLDGASGHAGVFGGGFVLGQSDATNGFDGEATGGAVTSGAREDHADGAVAAIFGEGNKETIDGAMLALGETPGGETQGAVFDDHVGVGGGGVKKVCMISVSIPRVDGFTCFLGRKKNFFSGTIGERRKKKKKKKKT